MVIALATTKWKAIPCKNGDGCGSMPPDMAEWVPDRHARRYNMATWRTEIRALSVPCVREFFASDFCLTVACCRHERHLSVFILDY